MNWIWKRKWKRLSLPASFVMLLSAAGTAAAAEPIGLDVQPAIMIYNESETVNELESETESEIEEETEEESESETEEENEEETESEAEEEDAEDNLPEDPDDEPPAEPEDSSGELSGDLTPCVHEHSWPEAWNYDESCHWHECGAEDCPVMENREKDGYAEHSYSDDNVCIICNYFKPVSRLARAAEDVVPTYQEAYETMIALKKTYPEGMEWTNFTPYGSNGPLGASYTWKGGAVYGAKSGVGCAAFAFILSDAAFGSLPARAVTRGSFTFEDVKVGDILRVNGSSHSVIVLQKSAAGVIIAEGNYNKSVHWGRVMTKAEVLAADFIITRYPQNYAPSDTSDADQVEQEGTAGNSLSWSLTKAGVLTISGNGVIPDYSADNLPPWNAGSVSTIIIEKGVTSIGDYAFYTSDALSIYIPDGIVKIGRNAFEKSSLISVTIPGTVGDIGDYAFHSCANLTSVTVSEGVKTIGNHAFQACTNLAYIDFPASITSVGAGAFMSCSEMTRVRFMPGIGTAALGDNMFSQCQKLTSVTLPQAADRISAGMFASCTSLPSLYIPAGVKEIGENPFTSCKFLQYIYFGGSEAEWKLIASPYLQASLTSTGTTVKFNVPFENPFAPDPNDPNDSLPDETEDESKTDSFPAASPSDGSNDNPGSSGSGKSGSINQLDWTADLDWQYGELQKQDELFKFPNRLIYSEMLPDSESESVDTKILSPQEQKESESALDDLSESGKKEIQQEADEGIEAENSSRSDKSDIGIIAPALIVPVAGFVFIRKRFMRKK